MCLFHIIIKSEGHRASHFKLGNVCKHTLSCMKFCKKIFCIIKTEMLQDIDNEFSVSKLIQRNVMRQCWRNGGTAVGLYHTHPESISSRTE